MIRKCIYTVGGFVIMLGATPLIVVEKLQYDTTDSSFELVNELFRVLSDLTGVN